MKLHLPKLLRAALLAVATVVSTVPAKAAAPATYGYLVTSTSQYYPVGEGTSVELINHHSVIDTPSMENSWVMSVAGRFYPNPTADNPAYSGGSLLFGNIMVPINSTQIAGDRVSIPAGIKENSFGIVFTEGGWNIQVVTKDGVTKLTSTGDIPMTYANRPYLQATVNWVADGNGKGTLYLTGLAMVDWSETNGNVTVNVNKHLYTDRFEILKNVEFTDDQPFLNISTTDATGHSEFATITYAPGSGNDPKAWLITGTADVEKLANGDYLTGDTAGADTANVQFTGGKGMLYLNAPEGHDTDTNGVYEYTYNRATTVNNDILNGDSSMRAGFGAAKDTKLIVGTTALTTNVLSADMAIDGTGTVKLLLGNNNNLNLASLGNRSNLEISNNGQFNLNLSDSKVGAGASITRTKDSAGEGNINLTTVSGKKAASKISLNRLVNEKGGISINGYHAESSHYAEMNIGSVTATGNIDFTGKLETTELTSGGNLIVGTMDNPYALLNTVNVEAEGDVSVYGKLTVDETINAESVSINMIDGINVTDGPGAAISAGSINATELRCSRTTSTPTETPNTSRLETCNISMTADGSTPLLSGNVRINSTGISANRLADNINIGLTLDGTQVWQISAASLRDWVDIDFITPGPLHFSAGSATALNLNDILEEVDATQLVISQDSIKAETITAGSINLKDNYQLSDAKISAPLSRTANTTTINANGHGIKLNNLLISPGVTLTNTGSATLINVKFDGSSHFGGSDGNNFNIHQNADSVTVSGELTGSQLNIDKLHVVAEELNFDTYSEYTLIDTAQNGAKISMSDSTDLILEIESWVPTEVTIKNGNIVISGARDEERFKAELTNTDNRKKVMLALEGLDTTQQGTSAAQLHNDIGQLFRFSLSERQDLLSAISGASTTALADSQRRGLQDVQHNLRNRVIQMGGGTNAGLTTDWDYVGLQAWAQADGGHITTDGSGDENGYDYDTWGATVGANLDLTPNLVVGMSFSASYGELDVDSADNATGNNDAYYLSLFARHQKERWVQMLILTAGINDMDLERHVGLAPHTYTGSGSTEGTTLSAYYELGYTLGLNYEFTHILQPLVSVSLTTAKVDGYTESGSIGNAALKYDGDSYFYGTVGIGARYQGVLYETIHERNAVIEARALVTQDFGDTTDEAAVGIGSSELYKVKGADSSGTGFELGAGLSLPIEQHTTFYADADVTFRPDSTGFRANIGMRYDF